MKLSPSFKHVINTKQMKLMVAKRIDRKVNVLLDGGEIKQVEDFKFRKSMNTTIYVCTKEIKKGSPLLKKEQQKLKYMDAKGLIVR